jgi:hypothetical protein
MTAAETRGAPTQLAVSTRFVHYLELNIEIEGVDAGCQAGG